MGNKPSQQTKEEEPEAEAPAEATPEPAAPEAVDTTDVAVEWRGRPRPAALTTPVENQDGSAHGGGAFSASRRNSFMWDWGGDRSPDPSVTPAASRDASLRNGANFGPTGTPSRLSRSNSSMWDWGGDRSPDPSVTPAASREGSLRNGGSFSLSREGSLRNGVSFWNWGHNRPDDLSMSQSASRESSVHGAAKSEPPTAPTGSALPVNGREGSTHGGGILRNFNWPGVSPSGSRPASVHGGVHFTVEGGGGADAPSRPVRSKTASFSNDLWNWGNGRVDPPATPEPSPVKVLPERRGSFGNLWDWGLGRSTPPQTPDASREPSVHNGERSEAQSMPWLVKVQFGQHKERPV